MTPRSANRRPAAIALASALTGLVAAITIYTMLIEPRTVLRADDHARQMIASHAALRAHEGSISREEMRQFMDLIMARFDALEQRLDTR